MTDDQLKLGDAFEASEFHMRVGTGANLSTIEDSIGQSAAALLGTELDKPYTPMLPDFVSGAVTRDIGRHGPVFWDRLIEGDDPVRQRMVFALSQIIVASSIFESNPLTNANYVDILGRNAFGNYRDLLEEITYSPKMASYLTYLDNRKGDPRTGRRPDENYAREILQLFSIGLVELNMDGTPRLGADGEPIETYTNDDVVGLARVFTGLEFATTEEDRLYTPLAMNDSQHSGLEKTFIGTTIPAGTDGTTSLNLALDAIFEHPNVAPFISRQIIQRFTQSAPDPAYVGRVASAFEAGRFVSADGVEFGTGERGDLAATLAATVLDAQFYDDIPATIRQGKVREPVLRFAQWAKAMDVANIDSFNEWNLVFITQSKDLLNQSPFLSATVFNFYRPGFVLPGSLTGDAGLTVPEFQVTNESATVGYINFMYRFVFDATIQRDGAVSSYLALFPEQAALADDPEALADHLDLVLMGGRMEPATRQTILDALSEVELRADTDAEDRLTRARLAIFIAVTSREYAVQY